jgi:hypothetical protein
VKLLTSLVAANLAIAWFASEQTQASSITLPSVGTNVNYDYAAATPQFVVAENAPSGSLIHSEVSFADNKQLFVEFEDEQRIMQIDLRFRGHELSAQFEPILLSFDESMSLELANGGLLSASKNTAVGNDPADPDLYIYSWTFRPDSDFSFRGFEWTISPDLVSGATLPASLGIEISFFASGAIVVVPEPLSVVGILIAATGFSSFRRRRK